MKNKKAFEMNAVIVGVFIIILSFMVLIGFFVNNKETISQTFENQLCRGTVEFQSATTIKTTTETIKRFGIDSFFGNLNKNCKVERIIIKKDKKEEVFKKVGDSLARCWYRYGEGKNDFLSNFQTTGNWCFLCGTVEFKEDFKSDYINFVNWGDKTTYKNEEGKKITYSNYYNLKYTEVDSEELREIELELKEILEEKESALMPIVSLVVGQYEVLSDLKLKTVSSEQAPLYLVYRFNRYDKNINNQIKDATIGVAEGTLGAIFISGVIEGAILGGATGVGCTLVVPVVGTAICGAGGAVVGFVKSVWSGVSKLTISTVKITRIYKLANKIKRFAKSTKIAKSLEKFDVLTYSKVKYLIPKNLRQVNLGLDEMKTQVKVLEELGEIQSLSQVKQLKAGVKLFEDLGVKNTNEFGVLIDNKKIDLFKVRTFLEKPIDELSFYAAVEKEEKLVQQLKEYNSLRESLLIVSKTKKELTAADKAALKDYVRVSIVIGSGAFGAYVETETNNNNQQYLDIMTKEQYHRLCGIERQVSQRISG